MDNKFDKQYLIIQATVEANKQETGEKQMKTNEKLTQITENLKVLTAFIMDQTNNSKFSLAQKDTLTPPDPTTVVHSNRRDTPLDGGHSTNIGGMWTLKHEIRSPKLY